MKDEKIVYWKDETLAEWLKEYKEKHGRYPEKPIYCDYRSVEHFAKEIIMYASEETDEWTVVEYDEVLHGKITEDRYHKFVPYRGNN